MLSVLMQVKAVSDCTVVPSVSPDTTWCSDCLAQTKTNAICAFCDQYYPYASVDKTRCTYVKCTSPLPSKVDISYCQNCYLGSKYINLESTQCIPIDCFSKPPSPLTNDFCWWCSRNQYPSLDGSSCINVDCKATPSTITESFCNACQYPKNKVNAAKNGCVEINCSSQPNSGAYTDDWCQNCSNPGVNALSDKTGCISQQAFTATVSVSSGAILGVLTSLLILVIPI